MPKRYTVRDEASGRTITFEWEGAEPPTDADLEEIFAEAQGGPAPEPSPADVRSTGDVWRGPVSRFGESAWEMVNPVNVISGVAQSVAHPIQTVRGMADERGRLAEEAGQAFREGRYLRGAAKAAAYTMPPIVSSVADQAIMQALEGDVAGGAGTVAGFGALVAGPEAVGAARGAGLRTAAGTSAGQRLGRWAQRSAENRLTSVMVPEVGANKVRFGVQAARVAPDVLQEPAARGAWTFKGLKNRVESLYAKAEADLDAAHQNPQLASQVFNTPQVIRDLKAARQRYIAETAKAKGIPSPGQSIVPGPNRNTVRVLNQMISELEQVAGKKHGLARFEAIRRIRESWDKVAKVKYNPSLTQDYMRLTGEAQGAYIGTSVLRDWLAKWSPETAKANASYKLWRTAKDVMDAVEEVERVRPSRRHGVEAAVGALPGVAQGDVFQAMMGAVVLPAIDAAIYSGVTVQPRLAGLLSDLATAIRTGNTTRVQSLSGRILDWSKKSAPVSAARPPTVTLVPQMSEERP